MNDSFSDFFYSATDGLKLHARVYGAENAAAMPVVCLPGLSRNVLDFHELAGFLATRRDVPRRVVAFDYRGRGRSDYDPDWTNYNLAVEARDVLTGLAALGIGKAAFIGTSRGGLIMHLLAPTNPGLMTCAVLNDIGPVVELEGLAHIKAYLGRSKTPATFDEALGIQRAIHGPDFPALTNADWARMVCAIYRDDYGRPVANFDPALANVVAGFDLDSGLPTLWSQFAAMSGIPLLVIRGEHSRLLSARTVREMHANHPRMQSIFVAGQGHPPMLESAGLPEQIAAFLDFGDATAARP